MLGPNRSIHRQHETPSFKQNLIQTANDIEDVLNAYESLAVRVFIFSMAVYGLIRAAIK
jgi:hypothetical protein